MGRAMVTGAPRRFTNKTLLQGAVEGRPGGAGRRSVSGDDSISHSRNLVCQSFPAMTRRKTTQPEPAQAVNPRRHFQAAAKRFAARSSVAS
jgi:hypothetical protein